MASASSSDLPPRVVNGRRSPRRRTLLAGKVVYGEGTSLNCSIRDLSETGAKIRLGRGECVPTRVILLERRSAMAYQARVIWIKAPDFGLAFDKAYDLRQELPPELSYVARVWAMFRSPLANTQD